MTSDAEIRALIEQVDVLLTMIKTRQVSHPLIDLAVELLQRLQSALEALLEERDKAREYGGQARIREIKAENARILAQSRIIDLEAKLAKAREALAPFAKAGELFTQPPTEFEQCIYRPAAGDEYALSENDIRRARSTLEALK